MLNQSTVYALHNYAKNIFFSPKETKLQITQNFCIFFEEQKIVFTTLMTTIASSILINRFFIRFSLRT